MSDSTMPSTLCRTFANLLGGTAEVVNGVCTVTRLRTNLRPLIQGRRANSALAIAALFSFEDLDSRGNALNLGETVILQEEVNPFISELRQRDIEVTALHNHWLFDNPRLMYIHFKSVEPPLVFASKVAEAFNVLTNRIVRPTGMNNGTNVKPTRSNGSGGSRTTGASPANVPNLEDLFDRTNGVSRSTGSNRSGGSSGSTGVNRFSGSSRSTGANRFSSSSRSTGVNRAGGSSGSTGANRFSGSSRSNGATGLSKPIQGTPSFSFNLSDNTALGGMDLYDLLNRAGKKAGTSRGWKALGKKRSQSTAAAGKKSKASPANGAKKAGSLSKMSGNRKAVKPTDSRLKRSK